MSRQNQWFVEGDGIAREVITADIQRYLGPDALVRPGPGNEGQLGYWITAYRTLTTQMIADLKMDSQRWEQEQGRQEAGRGVAYQDSRTHAARQRYGPSESSNQGREREQPPRAGQYTLNEHYTTTPAPAYSSHSPGYPVQQTPYAVPRTSQDPYAYAQPGREHPSYPAPQPYASGYSQPATQDVYRTAPPPPTHGYAAPSGVAAPGYYIASDGRQYPLPQQTQQPQPSSGRRRQA